MSAPIKCIVFNIIENGLNKLNKDFLDRVKVMIHSDDERSPDNFRLSYGTNADIPGDGKVLSIPCLENDLQDEEEKILADFLSRQEAGLELMEKKILEIKKRGENRKNKTELKRLFQSLQNESGMLGMSTIEEVCYEAESLLENKIKNKHLDGLLAIKEWLKKSLDSWTGQCAAPCSLKELIVELKLANQSTNRRKGRRTE